MTGQKCRQKPKYPCCVRLYGTGEPFSFQQNYFPSLPRAAEDFQLRHVIIPFPSPLFRPLAFRWGRESAKFSFQALTSYHPPLHTHSLTCVGPLAKKWPIPPRRHPKNASAARGVIERWQGQGRMKMRFPLFFL